MASHEFDERRARAFRKTAEVLAFRTAVSVTFHKPAGDLLIPADGWVVVPLARDGRPTADLHGVDAKAFHETYAPTARAWTFRKIATVLAYQPGEPFTVRTEVDGHLEAAATGGSATAWVVRNPGGEVYPIEDAVFSTTYEPVEG